MADSATQRPAQDLRLEGLEKRYGAVQAVRGLDLHVPAGAMVSLIGSSGCGKTTTLRMIAGLEVPSGGRITAGGTVLSDGQSFRPPETRDMGMVFQTYALWPHMTVADNIAYGLRRKGVAAADVAAKVASVLELVNMPGYAERYPGQLSGGQQQRVALARAIASEPRTLLFDEPLSNLDAVLREQMRFEIRALQQRLGVTAVYVTHSQEEALALSDTIAVMRDGRIVQAGEPATIYNLPRNAFVASFIGLANILRSDAVQRTDRGIVARFGGGETVLAAAGALGLTPPATSFCVRPVDIAIVPRSATATPGVNRLMATIRATVFTGGLIDYFAVLDATPDIELRIQSTPPVRAAAGDAVALEFDPARTVALEPDA